MTAITERLARTWERLRHPRLQWELLSASDSDLSECGRAMRREAIYELRERERRAAHRRECVRTVQSIVIGAIALGLGSVSTNAAMVKVVTRADIARVLTAAAEEIEEITDANLVIKIVGVSAQDRTVGDAYDVVILDEPGFMTVVGPGAQSSRPPSCIGWTGIGLSQMQPTPIFAALGDHGENRVAAERLIAFLSSFEAINVLHAIGVDTAVSD